MEEQRRARPRAGVVRELEDHYQGSAAAFGMGTNVGRALAALQTGVLGGGQAGVNGAERAIEARSDRGQSEDARVVRRAVLELGADEQLALFYAHGLQKSARSKIPPEMRVRLGDAFGVAMLTKAAKAIAVADGESATVVRFEWLARLCAGPEKSKADALRNEAEDILQKAYDAYWAAAQRHRTPAVREAERFASEQHARRSHAARAPRNRGIDPAEVP